MMKEFRKICRGGGRDRRKAAEETLMRSPQFFKQKLQRSELLRSSRNKQPKAADLIEFEGENLEEKKESFEAWRDKVRKLMDEIRNSKGSVYSEEQKRDYEKKIQYLENLREKLVKGLPKIKMRSSPECFKKKFSRSQLAESFSNKSLKEENFKNGEEDFFYKKEGTITSLDDQRKKSIKEFKEDLVQLNLKVQKSKNNTPPGSKVSIQNSDSDSNKKYESFEEFKHFGKKKLAEEVEKLLTDELDDQVGKLRFRSDKKNLERGMKRKPFMEIDYVKEGGSIASKEQIELKNHNFRQKPPLKPRRYSDLVTKPDEAKFRFRVLSKHKRGSISREREKVPVELPTLAQERIYSDQYITNQYYHSLKEKKEDREISPDTIHVRGRKYDFYGSDDLRRGPDSNLPTSPISLKAGVAQELLNELNLPYYAKNNFAGTKSLRQPFGLSVQKRKIKIKGKNLEKLKRQASEGRKSQKRKNYELSFSIIQRSVASNKNNQRGAIIRGSRFRKKTRRNTHEVRERKENLIDDINALHAFYRGKKPLKASSGWNKKRETNFEN